MSKQVECTDVEGWAGAGRIAFRGTYKNGRGTHEVHISVPPETILRLADLIRTTGCTTEDRVAHAVYHFNHPELVVPCSSCEKDV